jgi:sterol desaturase/sphingolipid hydroxylase (fatty acid hydroxylase superfamily)
MTELWESWPMFCVGSIGFAIGLLLRLASGYRTFFTHTKSFPELAAFTEDDQRTLLHEASTEAFSALSFVPILVLFAFWWGGPALAWVLLKVTALPEWIVIVLPVLFIGLGYWLGRRLEAHRVKPFLEQLIDGQNSKTVA